MSAWKACEGTGAGRWRGRVGSVEVVRRAKLLSDCWFLMASKEADERQGRVAGGGETLGRVARGGETLGRVTGAG